MWYSKNRKDQAELKVMQIVYKYLLDLLWSCFPLVSTIQVLWFVIDRLWTYTKGG